ncbi:hypothetical protein K431DRAFT_236588 [Polychaeton citri CBS 116435]|uniref:Uncharacterized protein n=1 Tax=Polychaeton citri CBS 116435 TaxID=1314669 RepID=A0A9P4PY13_9PEZI|nr:hypothetical protein K431DRAFT_236588 [Polychaeton citri CBS 116435]
MARYLGGKEEVIPWLRRTGWVKYMKTLEREDLLQAACQSSLDADDGEPIECAIWQAMKEVTVASYGSVRDSGTILRMHAVRTEKDQLRCEALQPYWRRENI